MRDGTAILYEGLRRDGSALNMAMRFDDAGAMQPFQPPGVVPLRRTGWRVARSVRSESGASVLRTLEDAPFYARSVVAAQLAGEPVTLVHDSLSLERFRQPVVPGMMQYQQPRARQCSPIPKRAAAFLRGCDEP